jgi:hypothetical protein
MEKKHLVRLTETERTQWQHMLRAGHAPTRMLTRARMLLKADSGPQGPAWTDEAIQQAVAVGRSAGGERKFTVTPPIFGRGDHF